MQSDQMTRAAVAQRSVLVCLLQYVRVSLPLLAGIPDVSLVPQAYSLDVEMSPEGSAQCWGGGCSWAPIIGCFIVSPWQFSSELNLTRVFLGFFHVEALQHAAWAMGRGTSRGFTWDMPLGWAIYVGDSSFPESTRYCSVVLAVQSEE